MRTLGILICTVFLCSFMYAEPVKIENEKPVKFFELYGFFAVNNYLTYNLIMNGNNPYLPTTPFLNDDKSPAPEKLLAWANMQLFLEPVINIGELMEIHSEISIFYDKVLGNDNFTHDSQENGILISPMLLNTFAASLEGLWGSLDTPIGEFRVGRMPFNWGLGILYNDGNDITSTIPGDYMDRFEVIIPFAGFKLIPALDYNSEGPMIYYQGRAIDASQRDDGWQLSLMFMKKESDKVLKEKMMQEGTVIEFGALVMYSWKNNMGVLYNDKADIQNEAIPGNTLDPSQQYMTTNQNADLWTIDGWINLYYKNFSLKAELAFMTGTLGKYQVVEESGKVSPDTAAVKTQMVGAAIEAEYRIIPRQFHLQLYAGVASPSYGSNEVIGDSWNMPGNAIDRTQPGSQTVTNFRFNRNYKFHSLLWNYIFGRFTSGYYASLGGQYFILDELSTEFGATYSGAFFPRNTLGDKGTAIALEPFVTLQYETSSGVRAGIEFMMTVPFDGLNTAAQNSDLIYMLHSVIGFVFQSISYNILGG